MRQLGAPLMAAAVALGAATASAQDAHSSTTPLIVTTGDAVVRRAPDQAFVIVAVETRARIPRDAQKQNADLMASVQQKLQDAGIPKDAVRTTGYAIQQEFDFNNGRRTPREYVARNGIEVRLDAVERVGEVLDVAVQSGATSIAGVRFDLRDRAGAEREALRRAVVEARARAEALASGAGQAIDRIVRIEDGPREFGVPMGASPMMRSVAADAAPTPIEGGTIEIRAHVTLTAVIK